MKKEFSVATHGSKAIQKLILEHAEKLGYRWKCIDKSPLEFSVYTLYVNFEKDFKITHSGKLHDTVQLDDFLDMEPYEFENIDIEDHATTTLDVYERSGKILIAVDRGHPFCISKDQAHLFKRVVDWGER